MAGGGSARGNVFLDLGDNFKQIPPFIFLQPGKPGRTEGKKFLEFREVLQQILLNILFTDQTSKQGQDMLYLLQRTIIPALFMVCKIHVNDITNLTTLCKHVNRVKMHSSRTPHHILPIFNTASS